MTTTKDKSKGLEDLGLDELEDDSLPIRTPTAAAAATPAVTGEGASDGDEGDDGDGEDNSSEADADDPIVTVARLGLEKSQAKADAATKKAAADVEVARLSAEAATKKAASDAEVAKLALEKSKTEAEAAALKARTEAAAETNKASASVEIAKLSLEGKQLDADAAADKAEVDAEARAEAATEKRRLEDKADAAAKKAEAEAKAATDAEARAAATAKAEADAEAARVAKAEAAAARTDLFRMLDELSQIVRSKDSDGKLERDNMPHDERMARVRGLLNQLSHLLAEAAKLGALTSSETAVRAEALIDKTALEDVIKLGTTPKPAAKPAAKTEAEAEEDAEAKAEAERKAEFDKNFAAQEAVRAAAAAAARVATEARAKAPTGVHMPAPAVDSMPGMVRTRIRVGRDPGNDWVIDDRTVSAHHAVLTLNEGSIKVEDLNSSNGTFLMDQLGVWRRIAPSTPGVAMISQPMKFGDVIVTSSHDDQNLTHLHFMEGGKASLSQIFFIDGERIEKQHRAEQAKLDAAAAAQPATPRIRSTAEVDAELASKRSATQMQREVAAGGSTTRKVATFLGGGLVIMLVVGCIVGGGLWMLNHMPGHDTVAEVTEPVAPVDPTTPVVETPTTTVTYTCRPGSERSDCSAIEEFLLGGGEASGSPYWNCSALSYEQYREVYSPTEPRGAEPNVVANVCACQYCEPTSTDS